MGHRLKPEKREKYNNLEGGPLYKKGNSTDKRKTEKPINTIEQRQQGEIALELSGGSAGVLLRQRGKQDA